MVRSVPAVIIFDGDIEDNLQIYEDLFESVWPCHIIAMPTNELLRKEWHA